MAEVRPFHGIRYNQSKVPDLDRVICPPYDIISPEEQRAYHQRSDFNIISVEFGLDRPGDNDRTNKYTRARRTWQQWLRDNVLTREPSAAFYVHKHAFRYGDKDYARLGLIGAVRLEPWDKKIVLPHEHTGAKAKQDRLELMRACQSNVSPIFGLYQDRNATITGILQKVRKSPPVLTARLDQDAHRLWPITVEADLQAIGQYFAGQRLFIADGHHRYETALAFSRETEQSEKTGALPGAAYVMMTLVEFSDPGLLVLPVHRLVRGLSSESLAKLRGKLESLFDLKALPLRDAATRAADIRDALRRRRGIGMAIGLWGLEKDNLLILRQRPGADYQALMPAGHSYYYYRLEVSRLQHLVMEGLEKENPGLEVAYTPDEAEVLARTASGEFQLGFFIKSLEPKDIKGIALAGDKVPRKSTYFHPKLPTGLVMRSLDGL